MARCKRMNLKRKLCRLSYRSRGFRTVFCRLRASMKEVYQILNPRC